jgi:predicted anti-sigma-YlaC factor YlaD
MKRALSFILSAVVIIGVLVLFIVFAHHSGPGESTRDDNNTKTASSAPLVRGGGVRASVLA